MSLRRTLLAAALVSSLAAVLLGYLLNGGASLASHGAGGSEARSWAAAPLMAFAIIGTMGCLVGALAVGGRR